MTMQDNWTLSAARSAAEGDLPSPFDQSPTFKPALTNMAEAAENDLQTARQVAEIKMMVGKLVDLFGLKDYFSADFRVSETGQVYFIEFEVCPAVTIYDFLTYLEELYDLDLPTALSRAVLHSFLEAGRADLWQ
jgi:D-alanine-D-alanine ligase